MFGGRDGRQDSRYGKIGGVLIGDSIAGETTARAITVERRDISGWTVKSGRIITGRDPEQAAVSDLADLGS